MPGLPTRNRPYKLLQNGKNLNRNAVQVVKNLTGTAFRAVPVRIHHCPGDAPATITQYVAWMERQFNACQTPRSKYLSIFNSLLVSELYDA